MHFASFNQGAAAGIPCPHCIHDLPCLDYLLAQLEYLKTQVVQMAYDYYVMGEEFHTLPWSLARDNRVSVSTQGFAHDQFHVLQNRELPPMIQALGTLNHVLRVASSVLIPPPLQVPLGICDIPLQGAQELLCMAEFWLTGAYRNMNRLQRTMDAYREIQFIDFTETGWERGETLKGRERREYHYERWIQALPTVGQW